MTISTGTNAITYRIDEPCPRLGWDDQPDDRTCLIAPLDHYGQPTGELFCYTHFSIVGVIR